MGLAIQGSYGAERLPIPEPTLAPDYYSKGKGVRPIEELKRRLAEEVFSPANVREFRILFENSTSDRLAQIQRSIDGFISQKRTTGNSIPLLRDLAEQLTAQRALVIDKLVEVIADPKVWPGTGDLSSVYLAALLGADEGDLKKLASVLPKMLARPDMKVPAWCAIDQLNRKGLLAQDGQGYPQQAIFQALLAVPDPTDTFCGNAWMEKHRARTLLISSKSGLGAKVLAQELSAVRPGTSRTALFDKLPQAFSDYAIYPVPELAPQIQDLLEIVRQDGNADVRKVILHSLRGITMAIRKEPDSAPHAALLDYLKQGAAGSDPEWSEFCQAALP